MLFNHDSYVVPVRQGGLGAAFKSLIHRKTRAVEAVKEITFAVAPGEIVGFLGPNGAGKTTTLKMLSGLLHPSGGQVEVLGHEPFRRQKAYLRQITLVMGNRNQLVWDIPVLDSFERNRAIYRLDGACYRDVVDELVELLDLGELLDKPVRNLSLGERMKCEVAAALLHRPRILFLDEPTIGLDVTMQRRIRHFIAEYNRRYGASVLLTSHYMADVEALCRRVVIIHHGQLLFDGQLEELVQRFSPHKTIAVELADGQADLTAFGQVVESEEGRITLHPIHRDIVDNIAYKALTLTLTLPVACLLAWVFEPTFLWRAWSLAAFAPALVLSFLLRFMVEWSLALAAFWTTRVMAINEIYMGAGFFLSGQMAPLELMPGWVQTVAAALPFRWMVVFPVELLLGRLTPAQALHGFAIQIVWIGLAFGLVSLVWSRGVKRYAAVGS